MKINWLLTLAFASSLFTAVQADPVFVDGNADGDSSTSFNPNGAAFVGVNLGPATSKPDTAGTLFSKPGFLISFEITADTDFAYEPVSDFDDFDPVTNTTLVHSESQVFPGTNPSIGFTRLDNGAKLFIKDIGIGFDATRSQGSGFFLEDLTGDFQTVLFDLDTPTAGNFSATAEELIVESAVLFSPEFSTFLQNADLTTSATTGTNAGTIRIDAVAVPEPTSVLVLGAAAMGLVLRRRRA